MATPRRQSARVSKPVSYRAETEEEESTDDGFESGLTSESEEEASDWEGRTSRAATGKAPAKRAKHASSSGSKGSPQKVTRGKKSLGLLLDMPLDILFEILGMLAPKDLVNLTRTSKSLRQTLMTRNAITVWKTARNILGIPDCPSDFSEPKWAVLISGSTCQNCGAKSVHKVDFYLRRRVCTRCKKNNLIVTSKFAKECPTLDPIILNFTPYTNVGGWAHGHASGSRFYWKADIEYVAREWETLQKNLQTGLPKAKEKLNEFKLARIDLVDEITKYAIICEDWADTAASQRNMEAESKRDKRYHAIVEKFKELGYIDEDIQSISMTKESNQSTELTDKIWRRIQPILEPVVQARKTERLVRQRKLLVQSRMTFLKTAYQSYLKTLVPSEWIYQARVEDVAKFPIFDQVLGAKDITTFSTDNLQEPISMLPGLITEWIEGRRADLRSKLPPSKNTGQISSLTPAPGIDPLTLATSVFECARKCLANQSVWGCEYGNPLFGWDGVAPHHCTVDPWRTINGDSSTMIAFSEKGSAAAAKFVAFAGLDVATTTPADMDKKDLRFFCSICGPKYSRDHPFGRCAYTWRSGVAHHLYRLHSTEPTWTVLTAQQATNVTKPEETDPIRNHQCWTCSHCSIYLDAWVVRQTVVEHLQATHNISNPKEPNDLFFLPNLRSTPLTIPMFKMSNPNRTLHDTTVDIKCKHCPSSNKQLFMLSGMYAHLKDKHEVQNPVKGRDWEIENITLTSSSR
ncbi:hypothetical protein BDZ94DRAFT_532928 [Collybia nuda]|uniref:F-box domain-containing protein n=1 Tax=Collybia nuda TaxID=64659 RepID=A0A9P5Y5M3_9AGAR|nr:hypothetical protein BDZ94DRAFT_532928 [Collybia nuda]